jgi:hypothetical protein
MRNLWKGSKLEQSIDERCYGRTLGEDDQTAEDYQHQDHRRQPPSFVVPEKRKQLIDDTRAAGEIFKNSHYRLPPSYCNADFSIT